MKAAQRLRPEDLRAALYAAALTVVAAFVAAAHVASSQQLGGYLRWRACADGLAAAAKWPPALALIALLQSMLLARLLRRRRRAQLALAAGWLLSAIGYLLVPALVRVRAARTSFKAMPFFHDDAAALAAFFQKNLDNLLMPDRLWTIFGMFPALWALTLLTPVALGLAAYAMFLHWPLRRWSAVEPAPDRTSHWAAWLAPLVVIAVVTTGPSVVAQRLRPPAAGRPDLILISIDTLRQDEVGVYGDRPSVTPNLDRLAANGVRLTGMRAPSSWTLPSHASMLTGRWPWSLGMGKVADGLPPGAQTLAAALSSRGYDAMAVVTHLFVDAPYGFGKGFSRVARPPSGRADDAVAAARAWLARRPADRPAFLFLHLYDPHWPYRPASDVPAWVLDRAAPADREEVGGYGDAYAMTLALKFGPPSLIGAARALYRGAVWGADRALGRLLDDVAARRRPTYVVALSDHGELFGEHENYGHGISLFEEEVKVPCVIAGPRVPAGLALAGPASVVDVAPTALDLLGLPGLLPDADGRSLAEAVRSGTPLPTRWTAGENRSVGDTPVRYVSDGVWKWLGPVDLEIRGVAVRRPASAFRLDLDPGEATDRIGDPAAPDFPALAAGVFRAAVSSGRQPALAPAERAKLKSLGYLP